MRKKSIFFSLLLCILLFTGCFHSNSSDSSAPTDNPDEAALQLYEEAINAASQLDDYTLQIVYSKNSEIGSEVFQNAKIQTLSVSDLGKPTMAAALEESQTTGSSTVTYSERYINGVSYLSFDGANFCGNVSEDEFMSQFVPLVLLTPANYNSHISTYNADGSVTIQFYSPNALESWAASANTVLSDASGRVILTKDGVIRESHCYLTYTENNISVTQTVSVTPDFTVTDITVPENIEDFISIESVYAPRILEETCNYLLQCDDVIFSSLESVRSDAFSVERTKQVSIKMSGANETLNATIDTCAKQIDNSLGGSVSELQQKETFSDGVYSITDKDGSTYLDSNVTSQAMQTYCRDLLVENILLSKNITEASLTQDGNTFALTFTASDDMAQVLRRNASETLCGDATFLDTVATDNEINFVICTLTVDATTGLIQTASTNYIGKFTIDEATYLLNTNISQIYQLAGLSSVVNEVPSSDISQ